MNFLYRKKEKKPKIIGFDSKKDQIDKRIVRLLRPGRKVDVVFYTNLKSPDVKPAIIYDCDHNSRTIVLSQTNPVTHSSTRFEKMGITTLISEERMQKKRVGVNCKITKFIRDYALNEKTRENAIIIKYYEPMETYNIREAYRFEPPSEYEVTGNITHKGSVYLSKDDFNVQNISIGGAGIIVRNSRENGKSPLLQLPVKETIVTELNFINFDSMAYENTVFTQADVVWKDPSYSANYGYIGTRFVDTNREEIDTLHKFIHNGQLMSIRMTQGLSN